MFSKRLKELRIKNNLTQFQLAEILNVSGSTITMYENSKRTPDINTIIKISIYFNVSIDYLLGLSNVPNANIINESEIFNLIKDLSQNEIDLLKIFIKTLTKEK